MGHTVGTMHSLDSDCPSASGSHIRWTVLCSVDAVETVSQPDEPDYERMSRAVIANHRITSQ